jgi:hypothetical protein
MFVCRKTYAETRLMPFRERVFWIGYGSKEFFQLQAQLGSQHLDAIGTVMVVNSMRRVDKFPWWKIHVDDLKGLRSLERVILQGYDCEHKEIVERWELCHSDLQVMFEVTIM